MAHGSIPGWLRHFLRLPPAPALSDAALLQRFVAEGDAEAFAALLKRHGPLVWGVCQRVLVNIHDAEDAFQATFLILASRAGAIRRPNALASFLHGVARRLAVRLKQRPRVAPVLVEPVVAEGPATTVSWREVLALLDEELQRLPERYRLPLVLCYLEGATRDEAAQQLGWSLATVRRRVDRGSQLLHARLLRRGVTLPAALGGAPLTELVVVPPTLTAAALTAARHWLAGPAENCLISASVLSRPPRSLCHGDRLTSGLAAGRRRHPRPGRRRRRLLRGPPATSAADLAPRSDGGGRCGGRLPGTDGAGGRGGPCGLRSP